MEGGAARGNNAVRWAALPLLLFLDGTDWAATITDAAAAADAGAMGAAAAMGALYVVRHGAVYYSLGKWVLEWNRQLFDGSGAESTAEAKKSRGAQRCSDGKS